MWLRIEKIKYEELNEDINKESEDIEDKKKLIREQKKKIKETEEGDIIEIQGSLVKATSNSDNWSWKSSLTRNDTGDGACEVILVKELKIAGLNETQVR